MFGLAALLPTGLKEWARIIIVVLLVAAITYPLGRCDGKRAERARNDAARAEANVQAMKTNAAATDRAANERVADAAVVSANEERLIDAIEDTPDTAPDAVRVRLGCERLRAAGTDTTAIAACR